VKRLIFALGLAASIAGCGGGDDDNPGDGDGPTATATGTGQVAGATTPAGAAATSPSPSPTQAAQMYTVAVGDTLWDIAVRFDTTVEELVRLNNLPDAESLAIGQQLLVSGPAAPATTSPSPAATGTPPATATP